MLTAKWCWRSPVWRSLVVLCCSGCEPTGPQPVTMQVHGRLINREDNSPVVGEVRLQHRESNGDWILTTYHTVVDASTSSDESGWYELRHTAYQCQSFELVVEATGFIPAAPDRISCVDGVQTANFYIDPGVCFSTGFFDYQCRSSTKVSLLTPPAEFAVRQNDPTIGCPVHESRGYGFQIRFAWIASTHAATARYRLIVRKRSAQNPLVDETVSDPEYVLAMCGSFVSDANLDGWQWSVDALDAVGTVVQSSGVFNFRFSPCRLASGRACFAS